MKPKSSLNDDFSVESKALVKFIEFLIETLIHQMFS